jgi:hypothetical protein
MNIRSYEKKNEDWLCLKPFTLLILSVVLCMKILQNTLATEYK